MAETPFIIQEQQFQKIKNVLARLCVECVARVVFLVDRDGQPIAFHGHIGDTDTTSFSSLAAGNVAATSSMAKLIGEDTFPSVFHEGERESIFISVIGRSLLVVVFDERSTLGLVKLKAKGVVEQLNKVFEEMFNRVGSGQAQGGLLEGAEDEIDKLFG